MAYRAASLSMPEGASPIGWTDRQQAPPSSPDFSRGQANSKAAPAPRFDDLREEPAPLYRRWLASSAGVHLILASMVLYAIVPGLPPQPARDPDGMVVTLADALPTPGQLPSVAGQVERRGGAAQSAIPSIATTALADAGSGRREPGSIRTLSAMPGSSAAAAVAILVGNGQAAAPSMTPNTLVSSRIPTLVASKSLAEIAWEQAIVARLERSKRLAARTLGAGASGTVLLRLVIGRDGRLLTAELAKSRGVDALDRAALAMASRASPFPAPPSSVTGDAMRIIVPVLFNCGRSVAGATALSDCGIGQSYAFINP